MKRIRYNIYGVLILMTAMACFASCVDDSDDEPNYIKFGPAKVYLSDIEEEENAENTRGVAWGTGGESNFTTFPSDTDESLAADFDFYGMYANNAATSGSTFITNTTLTAKNGAVTTTTFKVLWPAQTDVKYSFMGFHPTGVLTPLTQTTAQIKARAFTTKPYSVPTAASSQQDVLFALDDDRAHSGEVAMQFKHVLSRITFQAKKENLAEVVKITKVSIVNAANNLTGTLSAGRAFEWGAISAASTKSTFEMEIATAAQTVGTTFSDLYTGTANTNNSMFLFPHTTDNFTTLGTQLKVEYKVGSTTATPAIIDLKDITGTLAWTQGKWINYQITLKKNAMGFTVTVTDWTSESIEYELK